MRRNILTASISSEPLPTGTSTVLVLSSAIALILPRALGARRLWGQLVSGPAQRCTRCNLCVWVTDSRGTCSKLPDVLQKRLATIWITGLGNTV